MKTLRFSSRRRAARTGGFSLVEVTLALGIVAFAMVPLLALLSLGLNETRSSIERTALTQIVARISSDLQKLPFSEVPAYTGQEIRFDMNGVPIPSGSQGIAAYRVKMKSATARYPGSEALSDIGTQLQDVVITISPDEADKEIHTTTITVANSGYEG